MVADQLAKNGTTIVNNSIVHLLNSPSPFAMDAYNADLLGEATPRLVSACFLDTLL